MFRTIVFFWIVILASCSPPEESSASETKYFAGLHNDSHVSMVDTISVPIEMKFHLFDSLLQYFDTTTEFFSEEEFLHKTWNRKAYGNENTLIPLVNSAEFVLFSNVTYTDQPLVHDSLVVGTNRTHFSCAGGRGYPVSSADWYIGFSTVFRGYQAFALADSIVKHKNEEMMVLAYRSGTLIGKHGLTPREISAIETSVLLARNYVYFAVQ